MREVEPMLPRSIYLYDGCGCASLDLKEIARYLKGSLKRVEVKIGEDFLNWYLASLPTSEREREVEVLAREIAGSRVHQLERKERNREPLPGEIDYERRNLFSKSFGVLYDGFSLLSIFARLLPQSEFGFDYCHIILTNQLFGTWDESDLRFHARVSVYGFPAIISTTGIVEAPAKPREFYLRRQLGEDPISLKREFEGRFIGYDDPRMTEVMKGYVLQAVFFQLTGDPFCQDRSCRLYNAHWQEEVIQAQLSGQDLCPEHRAILKTAIGEES